MNISKALFFVIVLELVIGGGGRMFTLYNIPFRMCFFMLMLIITLLHGEKLKISKNEVTFLLLFLSITFVSSLIGFFNGAEISLIIEDIKPLLFFICIFYFSLMIVKKNRVRLVGMIIKKGTLFIAISHIILTFLLLKNIIDFGTFYNDVNEFFDSEFFFRGIKGFFSLKAHFFIVIGFFFWVFDNDSNKIVKNFAMATLLLSLLLAGQRGYLIFLVVLYFFYYFIPKLIKGKIWAIALILSIVWSAIYFNSNFDLGNKIAGDSIRIETIKEVFNATTVQSSFIGHGFGVGTETRPVRMEITFLEVFHKQGVLGLSIWFLLLGLVILDISKIKDRDIKKKYMMSVLFTYLISLTNPYLNNPIGISLMLIIWSSSRSIVKHENIRLHSHI